MLILFYLARVYVDSMIIVMRILCGLHAFFVPYCLWIDEQDMYILLAYMKFIRFRGKRKILREICPLKQDSWMYVCVFLCLWMSVRVWESDCVCILQFFMINFLQFPFCPMILKWNLWFLFITTKKNTWRWVCNTLYNLYISSAIKISMTCKTIWTI